MLHYNANPMLNMREEWIVQVCKLQSTKHSKLEIHYISLLWIIVLPVPKWVFLECQIIRVVEWPILKYSLNWVNYTSRKVITPILLPAHSSILIRTLRHINIGHLLNTWLIFISMLALEKTGATDSSALKRGSVWYLLIYHVSVCATAWSPCERIRPLVDERIQWLAWPHVTHGEREREDAEYDPESPLHP